MIHLKTNKTHFTVMNSLLRLCDSLCLSTASKGMANHPPAPEPALFPNGTTEIGILYDFFVPADGIAVP